MTEISTGEVPLVILFVFSICKSGRAGGTTLSVAPTAALLVPGFASTTIKNLPLSREYTRTVPSSCGVAVGIPPHVQPGMLHATQPSLLAMPKKVICGPDPDAVGKGVRVGVRVGV